MSASAKTNKELADMLRQVMCHRNDIAEATGCDPEKLKVFCRTWIYRLLPHGTNDGKVRF